MASTNPIYHVQGSGFKILPATSTTQELNSSGDKLGGIFYAPDDAQAITHIDVYCASVTGTPPSMQVVIEGYDATGGIPDGTDSGGGSPTTVIFDPTAATLHHLAVTNAFTPTEGTAYAAVLEYDAGTADTIDGANNSTFIRSFAPNTDVNLPYSVSDTAGSWAKVAGGWPCITPMYADGTFVSGMEIIISVSLQAFNTGDTPDEFANHWTASNDGVCSGALINTRMNVTTGDFSVVLYDSASSILNSVTVDGEAASTTGANRLVQVSWEDVAITGGATYRIAILPTTANDAKCYNSVFVNSAHRASFSGPLQKSTRTDAGAWTEAPTEIMGITPLIGSITGSTTNVAPVNISTPVFMPAGVQGF